MRAAILIPSLIAFAIIWSGVALVMHLTDPYIATPEKLVELVKQAPWHNGHKPSVAERKAFLQQVADNINKLDFQQKRRLREEGKNETEDFILDLTDEERKWFIAQTVEQQFQSVMKAFNAMSVDERRKMLNLSRTNMRKNGRDMDALDGLTKADEHAFDTMADRGVTDYYKEGDEKRKLEMAPLLEELQSRLQGRRR